MKDEIQYILSGTSKVKHSHLIQTACSYLKRSQRTSTMAQDDQRFKREEETRLISFVDQQKLWVDNIDLSNYVSQGAEQKVYLKDGITVLKLNDAIYYASWIDYFHNLLLNNLFFPDTAYNLLGFYKDLDIIYAVVEQPFVKADEKTDLSLVKIFLENNGFKNTKNHDYFNEELSIILEDLHDENVLTQNSMLYFIDTVFYIVGTHKYPINK
jgi:Serine/Threonine/Tyrosine Kinase found in polyvalent proteins